ncbi:MAG: sulfatase-like hydrolase/transferase [Verrucomicrobiae bacterium]|nr:sulfatase-like hydrolase/transferase [Verrucomicrobiae bacterium]
MQNRPAPPKGKPNILLIWTDQQRNDTLPCHGNTIIQAPQLRRLAEESFVFRRTYCTQPVCTPSRASILTGLWPHTHGCITNNIPLPESIPTIAEMLPEEYECAYYGKWHLGNELNAQHGFTNWRSIEDGIYRPYYANPKDLNRRSDYHHYLVREGFPPDLADETGAELFSREFSACLAERYTKAGYLAREAETFLRGRRTGDRPFFLSVNFLEPHPPVFGPLNYLHDPDTIPCGPAFAREPINASNRVKRRRQHFQTEGFKRHPLETESDWRRLKSNYYGLVTLVHRALGRILNALEYSGEIENTVVVFTSDHGDMMGDHCLPQKSLFYESASRVPLLLRVPWLCREQRMLDGPISQIDLASTLLDLVGAGVPDPVQGQSKVALLQDAAWNNRTELSWKSEGVAVEWNDPEHPEEDGRSWVSPDGWKLNLYRDDEPELFDLNSDPGEIDNLA